MHTLLQPPSLLLMKREQTYFNDQTSFGHRDKLNLGNVCHILEVRLVQNEGTVSRGETVESVGAVVRLVAESSARCTMECIYKEV